MNGDGTSCSREVELPAPRAFDFERKCYEQADTIARLERLLRDQEKLLGFGMFGKGGRPFGSEPAKENTANG